MYRVGWGEKIWLDIFKLHSIFLMRIHWKKTNFMLISNNHHGHNLYIYRRHLQQLGRPASCTVVNCWHEERGEVRQMDDNEYSPPSVHGRNLVEVRLWWWWSFGISYVYTTHRQLGKWTRKNLTTSERKHEVVRKKKVI